MLAASPPAPFTFTASRALDDHDVYTHESVARKNRARNKRAVDSAMKGSRLSKPKDGPCHSRRLIENAGPQFMDMTAKAVLAKAVRNDIAMAKAIKALAAAVMATRLADDDAPPLTLDQAAELAVTCGASTSDVAALKELEVPAAPK